MSFLPQECFLIILSVSRTSHLALGMRKVLDTEAYMIWVFSPTTLSPLSNFFTRTAKKNQKYLKQLHNSGAQSSHISFILIILFKKICKALTSCFWAGTLQQQNNSVVFSPETQAILMLSSAKKSGLCPYLRKSEIFGLLRREN